ncbi:MAG TPA: hypothetical protein VNL70_06460, partial [Tepidisphaeraceae bacterium]|nr:hypothetical protein [Tepidisphaeraceae bacterium]
MMMVARGRASGAMSQRPSVLQASLLVMPFIAGIVLYKVRARGARTRGCGGLPDLKLYCVARHRMIVNQKRLLTKPNLNVTTGCAGPQDWTVAQQS